MSETVTESGWRVPKWVSTLVIGRRPKRTLIRLVFLLVGSVVIFKFVLLPIRVEGASMLPTYRERGVNFVNRLAYRTHGPRRGDVVAIRYAGEKIMLMKRVIGLPGETVSFRDGKVFVNGSPLDEPYVKLPTNWNLPQEMVGPNQYYVVGDNRSMRESDHVKGRAERKRIVGRVLL